VPLCQGYYNHPEANAESFVGDGWFDSGDLGFLHGGRLFLTGRAKEMIIIRGANFYCYEIEDIVSQVPGTTTARIAATSVYDERIGTEGLLIFFVPDPAVVSESDVVQLHEQGRKSSQLAQLLSSIQVKVSRSLAIAPEFIIAVTDANFHRTTSGKIQRGAFKQDFLKGTFDMATNALRGSFREAAQSAVRPYTICWTQIEGADSPVPSQSRSTILYVSPGFPQQSHATQTSTSCTVAIVMLLDGGVSAVINTNALSTLVSISQRIPRDSNSSSPKLLLLSTRSAVVRPMLCPHSGNGAAQGGLQGLIGVVRKELPSSCLLHVESDATSHAASRAVRSVATSGVSGDSDIALRDGSEYTARIRPSRLGPFEIKARVSRGSCGITGGKESTRSNPNPNPNPGE